MYFIELGLIIVLYYYAQRLRLPLSLKYDCTSQTTWRLAVHSLIEILRVGLPVVRQHPENVSSLWTEITLAFDEFLFPKRLLYFLSE